MGPRSLQLSHDTRELFLVSLGNRAESSLDASFRYFDRRDLGGVGECRFEVVGPRIRAARKGGWGQLHKSELLGHGFGERIAGGLVF